jgi:hypothetical protein
MPHFRLGGPQRVNGGFCFSLEFLVVITKKNKSIRTEKVIVFVVGIRLGSDLSNASGLMRTRDPAVVGINLSDLPCLLSVSSVFSSRAQRGGW